MQKLTLIFPPPLERRIWHYNRADYEGIRISMYNFDWDGTFQNIYIDKQVQIFSNDILNIMCNFIPNEIFIISDKDPPWIASNIKNKIITKHSLFDKYIKNGRNIFDL